MPSSALRRLPGSEPRLDDTLYTLRATFAATAARHDADGSFAHDNVALLHRYGLIAQVVPQAFGGGGANLAQARRIVAAVAAGDAATALVLTMTYLQHRAIARDDRHWPAAVAQQVFASAVSEGALINALRVEPELGSPSRGGLPGTVAARTADGWRLRGRKLYCTGIPALRWLAVWARTDEPQPRVGVFLVPGPVDPARGIRVIENWNHLGLRASGSHETVLDDVWIPPEFAVDIRPPEQWAPAGASQVDTDANADQQAWMVVLLGSLYDAVARAAFDWIRDFVRTRAPASLGSPLATLPRVQQSIGEIAALLQANRALLDDATTRVDAGRPPSFGDSGLLKFTVTGNAIRAVELALQLAGNHGLSRNNPLERHYRDVLCSRVHTPQDDAILIAAGRHALT
ncbi:acyl-CoA dehydrogenase [Cupriavidus gilardii]|uniref:acyl-CoA dehydrogenase family protein n=1 Tax=Cupriavidus gilardii TaxID=82541 RepID=UPI001EE55167|nr:acyl-CoA dehydrogenase family protein [Cupriavidus gilardii]MCG5260564.1 acyl-CoA/acyl-ACP dehydrogenase [Cupriavidus gilardii]MDF9428411.1 acyl-CoA dehydrogenase [Cupriavidus gilardii]